MSNARSVILVLALFAAGFAGVRWVALGAPIPFLRTAAGDASAAHSPGDASASDGARAVAAQREPQVPASPTGPGEGISYYRYYRTLRPVQMTDPRLPQVRWSRVDLDRMTRDQTRQSALAALRRPGPALCGPTERGNFLATLRQYYAARDLALRDVGSGGPGQLDDDRAWTTPADKQIDGLVRDFYADGYLQPGDLWGSATVDRVLSGVSPRHRLCDG